MHIWWLLHILPMLSEFKDPQSFGDLVGVESSRCRVGPSDGSFHLGYSVFFLHGGD